MRAIVQTSFGPAARVVRVREIAVPTPGPGEVLVRVHATSVHADVWHAVTGYPYIARLMGAGLLRPSCPIPGTDLAGVVEAVGSGCSRFRVGDEVLGQSMIGMQWKHGGAWAELATAPARALTFKPKNVSFEVAASVPTAGYITLSNLRGDHPIEPGQEVLINGAGGGVGTIAVQVARARGGRVTAVDRADKRELLLGLGAHRFVDYQRDDPTRDTTRYHLIFDVASTLTLTDCKRVLRRDGKYVRIGHDHYGAVGRRLLGSMPDMVGLMLRASFDRQLPKPDLSPLDDTEAMEELAGLLETGHLTPVIDRAFPLEQAVEAMERLQSGVGIGRIVLVPRRER